MQPTKIEWTDFSWNPIKGLCPVGCWYCYGKAIYNRFEWMQEAMGEIGYLAEWELEQPIKRKKPTRIFVCSTYELFHSPDKFARDEIFKIIEKCPQHTFQILTKFPQNIDRPMPDNVWLGTTVTKDKDWWRAKKLQEKSIKAKVKFLSLEPLFEMVRLKIVTHIDWIIVGRLTGHGKKHNPPKDWLVQYAGSCLFWNIPFFMKGNLKEIWGEPLIQEFPE